MEVEKIMDQYMETSIDKPADEQRLVPLLEDETPKPPPSVKMVQQTRVALLNKVQHLVQRYIREEKEATTKCLR